mmetsp:Transcript_5136/g.22937  ORF Transcript_5136/g.22937 Transcript_5136/m.22937 type:complete len:387 (-) Transcript_5136:1220-2380(-)
MPTSRWPSSSPRRPRRRRNTVDCEASSPPPSRSSSPPGTRRRSTRRTRRASPTRLTACTRTSPGQRLRRMRPTSNSRGRARMSTPLKRSSPTSTSSSPRPRPGPTGSKTAPRTSRRISPAREPTWTPPRHPWPRRTSRSSAFDRRWRSQRRRFARASESTPGRRIRSRRRYRAYKRSSRRRGRCETRWNPAWSNWEPSSRRLAPRRRWPRLSRSTCARLATRLGSAAPASRRSARRSVKRRRTYDPRWPGWRARSSARRRGAPPWRLSSPRRGRTPRVTRRRQRRKRRDASRRRLPLRMPRRYRNGWRCSGRSTTSRATRWRRRGPSSATPSPSPPPPPPASTSARRRRGTTRRGCTSSRGSWRSARLSCGRRPSSGARCTTRCKN